MPLRPGRLMARALAVALLSASCPYLFTTPIRERQAGVRSVGAGWVQVQRRAAPAVAPVKPTTAPGMPSSPDPRRMGEAVRWLMDEDVEKPPEWHVLLLDKTFETRKNTVYRVTSSLMSELPLSLAEARSKAEHARDHLFSVLSTTPEWNKAIRLAQSLQRLSLAVRVVPGFDREAFRKGDM
ncbi:Uncharacterized protein SCF082_LOCUS3888 [Durusdinium trenchii]|uniref:Uncharacterized protein n=1 Tax=Durusdinium trenchii TaxID=1381693 RepID=A0ABP0HZJ0_9DINO